MAGVIHHPASVSMLPGEILPGGTAGGDMPGVGFLAIRPPHSVNFPIATQTYSCGFNKDGQIVGSNAAMPYPGQSSHYHNIPFFRLVDWADHTEQVHKPKTGCAKQKEEPAPIEIAEYFTLENDEGYQKWVEKKCEEKRKLEEKQKELTVIPEKIHRTPGHFMPTRLITANQTYGSYIDLLPKLPYKYPSRGDVPYTPFTVRVEQSNFSNRGPSYSPQFLIDPSATKRVFPSPSRRHTNFVEQPHEREKGYTFSVFSNSGLETRLPVNATLGSPSCPTHSVEQHGGFQTAFPGKMSSYLKSGSRMQQTCAPYCPYPSRQVDERFNLSNRRVVYEAVQLQHL